MKAVILCAGKSTRTYPLTATVPKPLLKVAGKTLIEHSLESLKKHVDGFILIVGYLKEQMIEYLGDSYEGIPIEYVVQEKQLGTGHALCLVKDKVQGKFILRNGDDIIGEKDIAECVSRDLGILATEVEEPQYFGIMDEKDGKLVKIVEKPKEFIGNLANAGFYVLDERIFEHMGNVCESSRGEIEVVDAITTLAAEADVDVVKVNDLWIHISFAWDLLEASKQLLSRMKGQTILGEVEEGATLKGDVYVGEGTLIRAGAYIEGPVYFGKNCKVGPNCYVRPFSSIGDDCRIGNAVEIKATVFQDHVYASHLTYIGDSVIGKNTNIGAANITANLRHDKGDIYSFLGDQKINTGRYKFGIITGEGVKTGINTSFYPGRKLWPHTITQPGEIVKEDKTGA